jgi:hypothetical protein
MEFLRTKKLSVVFVMESISLQDVPSKTPWPRSERKELQMLVLELQMRSKDPAGLEQERARMYRLICETVPPALLEIEWAVENMNEMISPPYVLRM